MKVILAKVTLKVASLQVKNGEIDENVFEPQMLLLAYEAALIKHLLLINVLKKVKIKNINFKNLERCQSFCVVHEGMLKCYGQKMIR